MKNFLFIVITIAFFGTCTNIIPLSAIVSPLGILLLPLSLNQSYSKPKFLLFLYLFFFISIISLLFYDTNAFVEYDFYRYDGNFIVSYAPLLLIPLVSSKVNVRKLLYFFILFETIINLLAFFVTIVGNGFLLSAENSFGGLFIARNAAGGFFSFCLTACFLIFWENKSIKNFSLLSVNLIFLLATYSRGSLLGLAFCIILFIFFKRNLGKSAIIIILICLVVEVVLVMQTFDFYKKAAYQLNGYDYVIESFDNSVTGKSANISIRLLFNWPSGIDEFMHSPIFGAGYGSINDRPYVFYDSIDILNLNKQEKKIYSDAHAHNTYFHIAGEQGLLGVAVFFSFVIWLFKFFDSPLFKARYELEKNVVLLYLCNICFMSLTEHRLTTPSNVLPFSLFILLIFADYNSFIRGQSYKAFINNKNMV